MVLPTAPISLSNIQNALGGVNPIQLSEYYSILNGIPSTGMIALSHFQDKDEGGILIFDASNTTNNGIGSAMTTWTNQGSLASMNLTAVNGPVLRNTGRYYVEFNRASLHYFTLPSFTQSLLTWGGMTVFIVGQMTSAGSWERFIDFGNGPANDNIFIARLSGTGNLMTEVWNGRVSATSNTAIQAPLDANWHVWCVAYQTNATAGSVVMYCDNVVVNTWSGGPFQNRTTSSNFIGRSNWNDAYLQGNISEVRVYNQPFSAARVNLMCTALKSKWGL